MNWLFWNTNRKTNINSVLKKMIVALSCDVIALAEYHDNINILLKELHNKKNNYYYIDKIACDKIDIITKLKPSSIVHLTESEHYTIKRFPHKNLDGLIAAFVHFPSKLRRGLTDLSIVGSRLKNDVEIIENTHKTDNTILVGDFNMNPFDEGMLGAGYIHSVPSMRVAKRISRKVDRVEYKMFYNPMWNLFGDIAEPSGTYYYGSSGHITYFWHIFDQVIIRPSLQNSFNPKKLKIIDKFNEISLVNENGQPSISDHLPIYFEIE